jgi:hypothetical protein
MRICGGIFHIMKLLIIIAQMLSLMLISSISFADDKLDRCNNHRKQIISTLENEGISSDYYYLAVCESGCRIKESKKGARGFFQIMPNTFRVFKDSSCTDIDDITCNTIAAARYIKHLQKRFKDMFILIKAYNRGGTNFIRKGTTKEADGLSLCVRRYIESNN